MDLKIFAKTVEQEVHDQLRQLMSIGVFKDAKVRIMPDTHAGKGCVIGFTANLGDKVVPNLVGVDIGCGMYVCELGDIDVRDKTLSKLDEFIRENIPAGMNVNDESHSIDFDELDNLLMRRKLRNIEHLQASIGSLGGGNHFIELNKDSDGCIYLVIHTGSRNLGQQVCRYYQKVAIENSNSYRPDIDEVIGKLKEEGRQKEISEAIKKLKAETKKIPDDLCWLEGEDHCNYLYDMKICQRFAVRNREEIAYRILNFIGATPSRSFHCVHNYIDFSDNIIRKGAINCAKDLPVIIPLNMRDGSILGFGKGNEDWNNSGPHGAGRLMSRSKARDTISMDDFNSAMAGIFTTSVNESTLDESPMAYKDASEIIDLVKDTIEISDIIKPIYNFKASE